MTAEPVTNEFLMSTEQECLTATPHAPRNLDQALAAFFTAAGQVVPSMHGGGGGGFFNGYGRVYLDNGSHVELALCECDSPYLLPLVVERQQEVLARAVARLAADGHHLVLANNNHSGLLEPECSVWGSHENYLVEQHPWEFGDLIVPFLATRIYAGAGGVEYPSGNFLAGVRPTAMVHDVGGGTTSGRAVHSTARDEPLMGPCRDRYRYHLIVGDGHRCQFNLALQFGATALVVKAIAADPRLPHDVAAIRQVVRGPWLNKLRQFNVLATPSKPPRVHPQVIAIQRVYLAACERFVRSRSDLPEWVPRLIDDWRATLEALERLDLDWLAARLDAFAKYRLYTEVLRQRGTSWARLPRLRHLFHELALLDQSYHEFCNPHSVFRRLELAGALAHRVGPRVEPGQEADPFVPETTTRARARARFIRAHVGKLRIVDWSWAGDLQTGERWSLFEPFAREFAPWRDATGPDRVAAILRTAPEALESLQYNPVGPSTSRFQRRRGGATPAAPESAPS